MVQRLSSAESWCATGEPGVRPAGERPRWERCVDHRGDTVCDFAACHFGEPHRRVLLVAGAGFDPRALTAARLLARVAGGRVYGLFLRERRPTPDDPSLLALAERQLAQLRALVPGAEVVEIPVFETDGAVGVGRRVVDAVRTHPLGAYTDLVVDFSALSIGSSFPVTRLLLELLEARMITGTKGSRLAKVVNLHVLVTASPRTDDLIVPQPSAVVAPVHGFRGRLDIDETARAARLWMPQLRFRLGGMLQQLYAFLSPHEVVPVLPFPAHDPRIGDRLIEHYAEEFDGQWAVDARSIVYADETDPLDYYRTVLRIDHGRQPVFASTGGSLLLLSPVGSKVLALGAMMAAMERDLPVVYVEALSYEARLDSLIDTQYTEDDLVHVWLHGEAYPLPANDTRGRHPRTRDRGLRLEPVVGGGA